LTYSIFKFIHVLGTVLLLGNVTVTSVWKVFADRTRALPTIAYAQRLVTSTDWVFTGGGALLIVVGGYGMAYTSGMPLTLPWLAWGQSLFVVSGAVWLLVLVPIQSAQSRICVTIGGAREQELPAAYWRLGRLWIAWGVAATVPLVAALFVMVAKWPYR
jgi:uncharacterized membrane protein